MRRARAVMDDDMSMEDAVAMNSGVTVFAKKWPINSVYQSEKFKNLLPYSEARVEEIKQSIWRRGLPQEGIVGYCLVTETLAIRKEQGCVMLTTFCFLICVVVICTFSLR